MKSVTVYSLFYLLILGFVSCKPFPDNYMTSWNNFTYKIESKDCNVQNFSQPFPKCDGIFGNLTVTDLIKINSDFLAYLITGNNITNVFSSLDLFCKAANTYVKCQKEANKVCKANINWKKLYKVAKRDSPIYRVTKDLCRNGKLARVYVAQQSKVNITTCLQNTLSKFSNAMNNYKAAITRTQSELQRDPSVKDTVETKRKLKVLCSVSSNLKRGFGLVGKLCSVETQTLLLKTTALLFPPEINGRCNIPNDNAKSFVKSYSTGMKSRVTVAIFGGFHKYQNGVASIETCNYNDNDNVTIFELDKLAILCIAGVMSTNYTYIKSCSAIFYDDNRNVIDSLNFAASGAMSTTFTTNGGTTLSSAMLNKGKWKPKLPIILSVINSKRIRVNDQNTGVSFTIILFTSTKNVNVYSIVIRLTKAAFSTGTGEITRQCSNIVKLSPKRRKRAATLDTTAQANYDAKNLNDTNAKLMSSNALLETTAIAATDMTFKNKGVRLRYSISVIFILGLFSLL